jgi:hypothetical protein
MSSIIKLVYGSEIKREIVEGKYHQTTGTTRLRETVDKIFKENKWQPDLFESLKKTAIQSILKKMISEQKAKDLPILLKKVEGLISDNKLKTPLTLDSIHQITQELHNEFPAYTTFEVSYLLRNYSAVKNYLALHRIIMQTDSGMIQIEKKFDNLKLKNAYKTVHNSSIEAQIEIQRLTAILAKKAGVPEETLLREVFESMFLKSSKELSLQDVCRQIETHDPTLSQYLTQLRIWSFKKDQERQKLNYKIPLLRIPYLYMENISTASAERIATFLTKVSSDSAKNKNPDRQNDLSKTDIQHLLFLHELTAQYRLKCIDKHVREYLPHRGDFGTSIDETIIRKLFALKENPIFAKIITSLLTEAYHAFEKNISTQQIQNHIEADNKELPLTLSLDKQQLVISAPFFRESSCNTPIELFFSGEPAPLTIFPLSEVPLGKVNPYILDNPHLKWFAYNLNAFAKNDPRLFSTLQMLLSQTILNEIATRTRSVIFNQMFGLSEEDTSISAFAQKVDPLKKTIKYLSENQIQVTYEVGLNIEMSKTENNNTIRKRLKIDILINKCEGEWLCSPPQCRVLNSVTPQIEPRDDAPTATLNEEEIDTMIKLRQKIKNTLHQISVYEKKLMEKKYEPFAEQLKLLIQESKDLIDHHVKQYDEKFKNLGAYFKTLHESYMIEILDEAEKNMEGAPIKYVDYDLKALVRIRRDMPLLDKDKRQPFYWVTKAKPEKLS